MCPVMPEEFASPQHEVTFRGVAVRLCCRTCREKFTTQPETYLHRLPHVPPEPTTAKAPSRSQREGGSLTERLLGSWWLKVNRVWRAYDSAYSTWRPLLCAALAVLVIHLAAARLQRRQAPAPIGAAGGAGRAGASPPSQSPGGAGATTRRGRLIAAFARPVMMLLALQTIVIVGVVREAVRSQGIANAERAARAPNEAVAAGAGRFAAELSRQALIQGQPRVRQLGGIYFRGNDERDPKLFNGGIYETCRFDTSIRDAQGKQVLPGDVVGAKQLAVRVELVRGPNTHDTLMSDESMTRVFLAGRSVDPWLGVPPDPTPPVLFRSIEPNRRWVAEHPIGKAGEAGLQKLEGVVLLCHGQPSEQGAPSAAHYGIQYHLRIQDGRIVPEGSRFWMAAFFFTSDLPDDRVWEWFSPEPLPTIPDGFKQEPSLKRDDEPADAPGHGLTP